MKRFFIFLFCLQLAIHPVLAQATEDPIKGLSLTHELIINEVSMGSEKNPEKDIWIELYNPTDESISLDGWQISGVTAGGGWVDLVNESGYIIEPDGYFLYSRYSNSASSALEIKPDFVRSNFVFPDIIAADIQLMNPDGDISDAAYLEVDDEAPFYSFERLCDDPDYPDEWSRPTDRVNLKEGLGSTYGTPKAANSNCEITVEDPVEDPIEDPIEVRLINEVMVNPEGSDKEGEWVELFNPTDESIDLGGWRLDDAEGASSPYYINRHLPAGGYLVLRGPDMDLSFKNSEDVVRLLNPMGEVIESIGYQGAQEGFSYAKTPLGDFEWTPLSTLGRENKFLPPPVAYEPDSIRFKQVLPNPGGSDSNREKIYLESYLAEPASLLGWKLKDHKGKEYPFEEDYLDAGQVLKFNPNHLGLTLGNAAGQLFLLDPMGNVIDSIQWQEVQNDEWVYPADYFHDGMTVQVLEVLDGDTFRILYDDKEWEVRMLGIDAPETVHPEKPVEFYGPEASDHLKYLLTDRVVYLTFDHDQFDVYGRLLAYVYVDSFFVNTHLLEKGYARLYTDFDFKLRAEFRRYEDHAKNLKFGLWKISDSESSGESDSESSGESIDELVEISVENPIEDRIEDCPTEGLKIQAILPNEETGVSVEYIQLINPTDSEICLKGWQLDDDIDKGSKPYDLEGVMGAGVVRSFSKVDTKINLNNSNDCANLINPLGEVADSICYKSTKKSEVVTKQSLLGNGKQEAGSSSQKPVVRSQKSVGSSQAKASVTKMDREAVSFQWDLKNETLEGKVAYVYDEGQIMYLESADKVVAVSFANSLVNVNMAKQLLDLDEPVSIEVRATEDQRELIGIQALSEKLAESEPSNFLSNIPFEWGYFLMLIGLLVTGFYFAEKQPRLFKVRRVY